MRRSPWNEREGISFDRKGHCMNTSLLKTVPVSLGNAHFRALVNWISMPCMAFLFIVNGLGLAADDPATSTTPPAKWVRPADWQPLPDVGPGEQKMVGLFAVFPFDENLVAIVAEGDYVVGWGDGSAPEHFKSGAKAEHNFKYATCGGPECSRGYKTVIVTVRPQAGRNLTKLDLNKQCTADARTNWLDLTISGKELTSLTIAWKNPCVSHMFLEQVTIKEHKLTDTSYLFNICDSLQSVPLFDTSQVTTMAEMFWGAMRLRTVPLFDTSNVTSMQDMFRECYALEAVPPLNTSKVTNMSCMFRYAVSLRTLPLLDTSNVTNMTMMFQYCWNLQRVPRFDTSKVTNMRSMFQNCFLLRSIPPFDTSSVKDMRSMFSGAQALLVIPALDVGKVDDLAGALGGCGQITQNVMKGAVQDLDFGNQNLSAAELNRIYANLGTVAGKTINVAGNYGTLNHDPTIATRKGWTVKDQATGTRKTSAKREPAKVATNVVELALLITSVIWTRPADWQALPQVAPGEQNMAGLFAVFPFDDNFVALSAAGNYVVDWGDGSAPERLKSGVTAEHTFQYASCRGAVCSRGYKTVIVTVTPQDGQSLTQLDLHRRHSAVPPNGTPLRTNWLDLTISGNKLTSLVMGRENPSVLHMLLEQMTIKEHCLTSTEYLFHQCCSLQSVPLFDTSHVTNMAGMFYGARSMSNIPLLDTSSVTNMKEMFRDCGSLKSVPMFNTAKVTNMAGMFQSAFLLPTLPLLNTSNVTNMAGMCEKCWLLEQVPLLNTAKVTNMRQTFKQCGLLQTVPRFDTSRVEDMRQTFMGAWDLLVIAALDVSTVADFTEVFGEADGQCRGITQVQMKGMAQDINLGNKNLSATELNRIFANLATVRGKVLSVDGNGGLANCDLSIATAKGWRINARPVVNAGPNQTITLPNTATVTATVTDDGYPNPPTAMTYVWSLAAWAPGPVTYSAQRAKTTTVTFSVPGRYVLRCAASDGHLSGTSDVVIKVQRWLLLCRLREITYRRLFVRE